MSPVLSVSALVSILNDTLELSFPHLEVEGEVVGFKKWKNRLGFFELQDDESNIGCMIPLSNLHTPIEDGMRVRVMAAPKVTKKGRLSITVTQLTPSGEGALKRAYELLKKRLDNEGLFDLARKRPIPRFPRSIGVITAEDSAAFHDFIKIVNQRWRGIDIKLFPASVQGSVAPEEIVKAISYFNEMSAPVDTLVLTRGGGSAEDLAAFNTEPVVRAVAGSRSPIVVGVGHEVDVSLADLAGDMRAATPTDAATLVVPDRKSVHADIDRLQRSAFDRLEQLHLAQNDVLNNVSSSLLDSYRTYLSKLHDKITHIERVLHGFNPEEILRQGYGLVRMNGKVLTGSTEIKEKDLLMIQLAKICIHAEVKNVQER